MTVLDLLTDFFASADQRFFDATPHDQAIAFSRAFAGCTLNVPKIHEIEREEKRQYITRTLLENPDKKQMEFLADRYGCEKRLIAKIVHKSTGKGIVEIRKNMAADAAKNSMEKTQNDSD